MAEPLAVHAGARLLGDLEPQHRPRPQRAREGAGAAGRSGPRAFRAQQARGRGLRRPLQRHPRPEHAGDRPLDVRTHRSRRRVDEDHAACAHCRPPLSTRNVFPYVLASRRTTSSARDRPHLWDRPRGDQSARRDHLPPSPGGAAPAVGVSVVTCTRAALSRPTAARIGDHHSSIGERTERVIRRFSERDPAGATASRASPAPRARAVEARHGSESNRAGPGGPGRPRRRRQLGLPGLAGRDDLVAGARDEVPPHDDLLGRTEAAEQQQPARRVRPQPQLTPARAEVAQRARIQRSDDPATHRTVTPLSGSTSSSLRSSRRRSPWPAGTDERGHRRRRARQCRRCAGARTARLHQQRADRRRRRHPAARRGCSAATTRT